MRLPRLFAPGIAFALLAAAVVAAYGQTGRAIVASQVSVTTTATMTAQARVNRVAVTIQNHGTTEMFCGPTNAVTTTTGFRLPGVDGASITIPSSGIVYCITGTGSQTVSVLESY